MASSSINNGIPSECQGDPGQVFNVKCRKTDIEKWYKAYQEQNTQLSKDVKWTTTQRDIAIGAGPVAGLIAGAGSVLAFPLLKSFIKNFF